MIAPSGYQPRIIDRELDSLVAGLPAVALEGAKGVGKTATAMQRARTVVALDDPGQLAIARADPSRLLSRPTPVLFDEWQRLPELWDLIRRAVDDGARPGSFLLTGSASPEGLGTHSGAGRIVSLRLRPFSLVERQVDVASVSMADLLSGTNPPIAGTTGVGLDGYVAEILGSGFPGLRSLDGRPLRAQLDGYIDRVVDRDFPELGHQLRNPAALRRWMTAYAAASSTTASFEVIRDAATAGHADKPAKSTVVPYRDVLERLWILDPVPAWQPTNSRLNRLAFPPKHLLVDPALAARLIGLDADAVLSGREVGPPIPRDGTLLGALFESLVTQSVRVYAESSEASIHHLRTKAGEHEIDLVVERPDGRILAIEVKLAKTVDDTDTAHLRWIKAALGDDVLDTVVVNTGTEAYRRPDGIAVVPASLLGP